MDYYCDIKVLPDPEASAPVLISNLMAKLHRALVTLSGNDIGVSFPEFNKTLGDTLRLHSSESSLKALFDTNWLKGLRDYCVVSEISAVPANAQFRVVSRKQSKSAYNKRKRSVAKGWLSESEAVAKIDDNQQKKLTLPFLQLKSSSTGQWVKLFIFHGELVDVPTAGEFNSYGLSKTATIPWF